ncbi:cache domain-containing protein [Archangium lansingense]|uniref:histidine kinase n=1 Tax=Archangium lansingense TaxID=2995310 RepID=A0ABT4AP34_9BACT|nr:cache domain-containing protein [Archangium lansinium]MCY1083443.1 cache domain-containing protein [Archangium lansinium]
MPRLRIHAKLLMAFTIVLLPVLVLLIASFLSDLRRTQDAIQEAQSMTARSVSVQIAETFDNAIGFGWAVAQDPLMQTMEPRVLDPHLQEMVKHYPLYDSIAVYDVNGDNRGWGDPNQPATPRLRIGDRKYFRQVMKTNAPVISEALELKRLEHTGVVACIPIRGPKGRPIGVVNIMIRSDQLAHRFVDANLQPMQTIFLADSNSRLAFHTGASQLTYQQSGTFMHIDAIKKALTDLSPQVARFTSPLAGDEHLGAFAPVPRYPWAVGISTPRDIALAPLFSQLRLQLGAFAGILLLNSLLALWLARSYARPVQQLQAAAQALAHGEREPPVDIHTGDELEELGSTFRRMAAEVARREAEVKALYKEAEQQALQLAAIIASVPDAIFLASLDGRVVGTNPAGLRLLGIRGNAELNMSLPEYLQRYDIRHLAGQPMEPEELPIVRALAGETFTGETMRLRSQDGRQLLLSSNGAPVRDASGQIILGLIVIRDITSRRQEEAAALQASKKRMAQEQRTEHPEPGVGEYPVPRTG